MQVVLNPPSFECPDNFAINAPDQLRPSLDLICVRSVEETRAHLYPMVRPSIVVASRVGKGIDVVGWRNCKSSFHVEMVMVPLPCRCMVLTENLEGCGYPRPHIVYSG